MNPSPKLILIAATALLFGCKEDNTFKDERDGKVYKYVKIGEQTWMAENLNYNAGNGRCYNNEMDNCEKYGRLYNWETAMRVCPQGWHLPSNEEWDRLYRYADGTINSGNTESPYESKTAGKFLKATSGWKENGNGEDKFGFAAMPGGYGYSNDYFYYVGCLGNWWSASEDDVIDAYYRDMYYGSEDAYWDDDIKAYLYSVRCVRD